jgi:transcriptional regulator with XRE-family HTH domain
MGVRSEREASELIGTAALPERRPAHALMPSADFVLFTLRDGDLDEPEVNLETRTFAPAIERAGQRLRSRINVASALLRARLKKGWTQKQLAEVVGTRQSRISELETTNGNPRFSTVDRVASALGLELTLRLSKNVSIDVSDFFERKPFEKYANVNLRTDVMSMLEETWDLLAGSLDFEKVSLPSDNAPIYGPVERRRASGGGTA